MQGASATLIAASSGPIHKAPGSAGGYLHPSGGGWVLAMRFFGTRAEYDKIDAESV